VSMTDVATTMRTRSEILGTGGLEDAIFKKSKPTAREQSFHSASDPYVT